MPWITRATRSFSSRVLAMPGLVDRERDDARRRARRMIGTYSSIRSRPFSMLIELMIARPGYVSSAARQRVGLERVDHQRRLDAHRELLRRRSPSGRPRRRARSAPRRRRGTCAPYSTWSRATCQHAVVVVGEHELLDLARALRVDALADDQRPRLLVQVDRRHARTRSPAGTPGGAARGAASRSASRSWRMCSGVGAAAAADHVRRPSRATNAAICSAISDGPSG